MIRIKQQVKFIKLNGSLKGRNPNKLLKKSAQAETLRKPADRTAGVYAREMCHEMAAARTQPLAAASGEITKLRSRSPE